MLFKKKPARVIDFATAVSNRNAEREERRQSLEKLIQSANETKEWFFASLSPEQRVLWDAYIALGDQIFDILDLQDDE